MAKKQKTVTSQKNKYRALQYSTFGGEFLCIIAPYVALGIANHDEWFPSAEAGFKVGLGGTLAMALLGIIIAVFTKKKENKEITDGYIFLIAIWFAITFIFFLLENIMHEITTIMLFGGFGLLGAFGLDIASKQFKKRADIYNAALLNVKKKSLEEEIQHEIATGRIKF